MRSAAQVVSVLGALAVGVACIPDPKSDYEDFLSRTANFAQDSGAITPAVDASFDAAPPTTAVEDLYVGICVTTLAARDPNQALRFYTETKFVPKDGGGGQVTVTATPLRGWDTTKKDFVIPSTVARSETRGSPFSKEGEVATNGRFTLNFGTVTLVEEANSISGRLAEIQNITLDGLFSGGDRFCSTLGGQLVKPYSFTFDPAQNTCVFIKVKENDPLPTLAPGEFVCPI